MQTEIVNINGVPTKVRTWGNTLKDVPKDSTNYIICIPGTPGITEFYTEFLEDIHRKTGQTVWIVGYAGHESIDTHTMPPYEENKDLYNLQGQVEHKISFIENHIPKNVKITLIAHSLGSYMSLKALQNTQINSRVAKTILLFPAIEHMAKTKNGLTIMNFWRHVSFALTPIITIFNILPLVIQKYLIDSFCTRHSVPSCYSETLRNFCKPFTLRNYVALGMDEMYIIRERDNEILKKNITTIKLYYGLNDNWVSSNYYEDLKKDVSGIDAQLCNKGIPHSFVFGHSNIMASMVVDWMKESYII